jgi:hypothetical protein
MSHDSIIRPFDSNLFAPIRRIYSTFGSLRSNYTILIIAAIEAMINKFRKKQKLFPLL